MKNIKVSVVIPVYNGEQFLKTCIESLIDQTFKDFEAIFVDDGSIDASARVIKNLCDKKLNYRLLKQKNSGPGAARNKGMNVAKGDYILFLDSDDYLENKCLEILYHNAVENRYDFLFYEFIYETTNKEVIYTSSISNFKNLNKKEIIKMMIYGKIPCGQHQLISRSLINEIKVGFDERTKNNEELCFKINLIKNAQNIGFCSQALYHYIKYPVSTSKETIKNIEDFIGKRESTFNSIKDIFEPKEYEIMTNSYKVITYINQIYLSIFSREKKYKRYKKELKKMSLAIGNLNAPIDYKNIPFKNLVLIILVKLKCFSLFIILCNLYAYQVKKKIGS